MKKLQFYSKSQIRAFARKKLAEQPLEAISQNVNNFIENLIIFQEAKNILFYWPLKNEINVIPLLEIALKQNKNCFLPKVLTEESLSLDLQIAFNPIEDVNQTLQKGFYGNLESKQVSSQDFEKLNLILVPGLAFDKNGYRLGRGKGFYDKLLAKAPKARSIGLTPEALFLERLNCLDEWDIRMSYIVSEKGIWGHTIK